MVTRKALLAGVLAAFFAGGAAGAVAGALRGFRAGIALILNGALVKDARDVGTRIAVLDQLRKGAREAAIAKIESGMDDLLVGFDPSQPFPGLENQTAVAMRKAIADAKTYRSAHPWPANQKSIRADMVRNLFARDLYKPAADGR